MVLLQRVLLQRILLPITNAMMITAGLFYCMFLLVDITQPTLQTKTVLPKLQWAEVPEDRPLKPPVVKPKPPAKVEEQPVSPKLVVDFKYSETGAIDIPSTVIGIGDGLITPSNTQLTLMLGQQPHYPTTAVKRGIEGFVVVEFSVDGAGRVFNPFVVEAEPEGVFEKSALKAIARFKYKPHTVNGKTVSKDGQQYLFRYQLDK